MSRFALAALAAALMLAAGREVRSQTTSASLAGRVETAAGEPVPGAVVLARFEATGATRETTCDDRGRYGFEGLAPGVWTVIARVAGGVVSEARGVTLRLQETVTLDFRVEDPGFTEKVTVRADVPLIDRRSAARVLTISGEQVDALPVAGRTLTDLALLDSAVGRAAAGTFSGEREAVFVVNGQSGRSNSFRVDGLDNNDATSGTTMNSFFSAQVIEEFTLVTQSYAPEFGGGSGGHLNVVTRQGSNDPGWGAFVQGTTDDWNETGDFVEARPDSGVEQEALERFAAGLHFAGPFAEDRAFYFAAYEHRESDDLVGYTGVDRTGQAGGRLVAPFVDDSLFLRTDFNLGSASTLMVRLSADERSADGVNVIGVQTPESGFGIDERDLQLAATLKTVLSPRMLGELRLALSSSEFDQLAASDRPGVTRPQGIYGGNVLNRQQRDEDKLELVQNLTWQRGPHLFKFGLDVVRSTTEIAARFNPNGGFNYDWNLPFEPGDCGDILVSQTENADPDGTLYCIGDPNGADDDGDDTIDEKGNIESYPVVYAVIDGEPRATLRDTRLALFAQDRFEVGSRLVLDYGLRYDLSTYELPASARVASTIPNGGATRDTDNVAPRLGFTFVPQAAGKLVIRGGGGLFYDKLVLAFPAAAAITSGTSIGLVPLQGLAFEFTEADVEAGATVGLVSPEPLTLRFSTGPELETPYTVQWNLGLERALGQRQAFRVDFVRSEGHDLPLMRDLNPVAGLVPGTFGLDILTRALTACPVEEIDPDLEVGVPCHARDPAHGSIAAIVTEGRSWYTGMSLDWQWRSEPGWLRASYTLSRAEDLGFDPLKEGIALPPDSDDIAGERGRSDGDRRHRFVLSGDAPLPFWGARLSGVVQLSSGLPYNVTTGQDDNWDGILTDRPPGVGRNDGEDSSLAAVNAVRDQEVVDLAPLASMPDEPWFFQVDLGLYKQFFLEGGGRYDVYLQAFNLFDRENVGLIDGRAISETFGEPLTLAGPPRTLELGLRVRY
jgi:hypothetical protein